MGVRQLSIPTPCWSRQFVMSELSVFRGGKGLWSLLGLKPHGQVASTPLVDRDGPRPRGAVTRVGEVGHAQPHTRTLRHGDHGEHEAAVHVVTRGRVVEVIPGLRV